MRTAPEAVETWRNVEPTGLSLPETNAISRIYVQTRFHSDVRADPRVWGDLPHTHCVGSCIHTGGVWNLQTVHIDYVYALFGRAAASSRMPVFLSSSASRSWGAIRAQLAAHAWRERHCLFDWT